MEHLILGFLITALLGAQDANKKIDNKVLEQNQKIEQLKKDNLQSMKKSASNKGRAPAVVAME